MKNKLLRKKEKRGTIRTDGLRRQIEKINPTTINTGNTQAISANEELAAATE